MILDFSTSFIHPTYCSIIIANYTCPCKGAQGKCIAHPFGTLCSGFPCVFSVQLGLAVHNSLGTHARLFVTQPQYDNEAVSVYMYKSDNAGFYC